MEANKTILQMKYARIVALFAQKCGMPLEDALDFFYRSDLYRLISNGVADMHCRSDEYLADELLLELAEKKVYRSFCRIKTFRTLDFTGDFVNQGAWWTF